MGFSILTQSIPEAGHGSCVPLVDALARQDATLFEAELKAGNTAVLPTEDAPVGGGAVGLCVSHRWIEGLRICRDMGIDPNKDTMLRDPLVWAYHFDDIAMAIELLDMGYDPLRPLPDTRLTWMPPENQLQRLAERHLQELSGSGVLGETDLYVLAGFLKNPHNQPVLNTSIGSILLNDPRPRALDFHRLVLGRHPEIASDSRVVPFINSGAGRHIRNDRLPARREYGLSLRSIYQASRDLVRN